MAVTELDLATTVVVADVAATIAAANSQKGLLLQTFLHIHTTKLIYFDNANYRRHLWKIGPQVK